MPLFYHKRTVVDPDLAVDEWIVDKIVDHRTKNGQLEFKTLWKGFDAKSATWEPVKNFIHRFNSEFLEYCQNKNIPVNLTKQMNPSQVKINAIGRWRDRPTQGRGRVANEPRVWGFWECDTCHGIWHQTNLYGWRWMERKHTRLEGLRGWIFHKCEECEGLYWYRWGLVGVQEPAHTATGMWDDGQNYWIFNGLDEE